jgi:hypothetical protein
VKYEARAGSYEALIYYLSGIRASTFFTLPLELSFL